MWTLAHRAVHVIPHGVGGLRMPLDTGWEEYPCLLSILWQVPFHSFVTVPHLLSVVDEQSHSLVRCPDAISCPCRSYIGYFRCHHKKWHEVPTHFKVTLRPLSYVHGYNAYFSILNPVSSGQCIKLAT